MENEYNRQIKNGKWKMENGKWKMENEYNRQRHKLKINEYNRQRHKERTHQYYLRKKSLQIPQNNEEKIIK